MKIKDHAVRIAAAKKASVLAGSLAVVLGLATVLPVSSADTEDHIVIVQESQTLKQIVEDELHSLRFARQIAIYNGFDGISTIVPGGTALQIPKPYMQDREFGRVVFTKGDVVHKQKRLVVNPPSKGAYVYDGDIFDTGADGFVSLSFSSGTVVNVQPESRISIADIECADETVKCVITLNAEEGELHSQITPRAANQPPVEFSVKTPFLSAAVRGTAFYVAVDESAGKLGVTRGLVDAKVGASSNSLPKGKGLLAKAGVVPAVVDLLEPPELTLVSERTIYSAQDRIHWKALDNAQRYRLSIAMDESMSQPAYESEIAGNSAPLPMDVPGNYFMAVAGIDGKEFLGLPASNSFSYASIDDEEALELSIERVGGVINVSTPSYTGSVELVLSNGIDGEFVQRELIDDLSAGLALSLSSDKDWVFQVRKVFSDTSVSVYGNQYLLEASK